PCGFRRLPHRTRNQRKTARTETKVFFFLASFSYARPMIIAGLVTVALLTFVPVMVWRCWNLQPVPLQRLWAVGFGAMSWAWIAAHWRAELWKKRYLELD